MDRRKKMMDIEYLETKDKLESINACAKYYYYIVYSDDSCKTYGLIRDYSDENKDGYETILDHMAWHEVVSVINAMYCIMKHECLEE